MATEPIKRWLVLCLIFSCITLLWFSVTVTVTRKSFREISAATENLHTSAAMQIDHHKGFASTVGPRREENEKSNFSPAKSLLPVVVLRTTKASIYNCSLAWNTIGLNVENYESENMDIIEPKIASGGTTTAAKPVFEDTAIPLDQNKFLLPVVTWGPNNQLVGFWEGVFVAIYLNRTVVLPKFRKHDTDRQWKRGKMNRISPTHRIDVDSLCKFVSCVTLDDFQKTCDYKVDAILNIRFLKLKQVREIESNIRMRILPKDAKDTTLLNDMLVPFNGTSVKQPMLRFSANELKELFNTEARCVIYPFPFFDVLDRSKKDTLYNRATWVLLKSSEYEASIDENIMANIMKKSQQPKYIRKIAQDFISTRMGGGFFMSVHWRYNEGDYLADWHCKNKEVNMKRCEKVRNYTAEDFAKRLEEEIQRLKKEKNIIINNIYIAAPRSGNNMVANVSEIFRSKDSKIISSLELERFMKEHYANCAFMLKHLEDILSSTEMEICARGVVFLGSLGTSWTGNVRKSRIFHDDPVIDTSLREIFRV